MLVLARKANADVIIRVPGVPDIRVRVVAVKGSIVRLGFDAPKDVTILRNEVERTKS